MPPPPIATTPRVLIIAGSDSGGGAGIQADIKTVTMLGGHAMTAITAITAQNTLGVQAAMPVPTEMVLAQIASCVSDIGVDAVKIGMIGSAATAHAVAEVLAGMAVPIVFDPVMVATSGDVLADADTIAGFERLMAVATVTTPNPDELARLSGSEDRSEAGVAAAAGALAERFGTAILATGTRMFGRRLYGTDASGRPFDRPTDDRLFDRLVRSDGETGLVRIDWDDEMIDSMSTHGTGCTLASAIALYLGAGVPLDMAIGRARWFVRLAIHDAPGIGHGHGPMGQQSVRLDLGPGARLNQITLPMTDNAASVAFYTALGLTRIVATGDGHHARFAAPGGATLSIERNARATVFLEHDDLDREVARLQAQGITFDQLPTDRPWGWREARLADPAGNAICLYHAGENRRHPPWRLR